MTTGSVAKRLTLSRHTMVFVINIILYMYTISNDKGQCINIIVTIRLKISQSVKKYTPPSVEIISFRGNSLPNRPIELKIGLNVREGAVHVRNA